MSLSPELRRRLVTPTVAQIMEALDDRGAFNGWETEIIEEVEDDLISRLSKLLKDLAL